MCSSNALGTYLQIVNLCLKDLILCAAFPLPIRTGVFRNTTGWGHQRDLVLKFYHLYFFFPKGAWKCHEQDNLNKTPNSLHLLFPLKVHGKLVGQGQDWPIASVSQFVQG